jgi:Ca2+-binding RTX toxin-like protein
MGGNDSLLGDMGNDTLLGGAGNDYMSGGAEDDSMNGGAGNDYYVVLDVGDIVTEAKGGGTDHIQTNRNNFTLVANVENLSLEGYVNLSAAGNALANKMYGNAGQNTLLGEAGNDTLDGGAGNDTLKGGAGNDVYLVDSVGDVVEEGIGGGKDAIRATFTYQLNDGQEIESFILDSNTVIGGYGNSQGNLITTVGTGAAVMYGLGGNDTLIGAVGNDVLLGDAGKDVITGGGGIDVLEGGADGDTLKGGAGDDVLVGGLGADSLFGEAGADWFSYRIVSAPELATLGNDTIAGFQKGVDKIDLRDLIADFGIDADNALAGKFVTLSKAGANTLVQFDQDGTGGAFSAVTLATVKAATVTAADLILETS